MGKCWPVLPIITLKFKFYYRERAGTFCRVVSIISPESFIISPRADYDHNACPRADYDHNARPRADYDHNACPRAVIMTVPKFWQNFSRNASGRLWEHKKPSCESLCRKILALIISPKSFIISPRADYETHNQP